MDNGKPAKPPLLQSITLQNFLSFGPEPTTIDLQNLNVLIGPNGSGKSNFLEALALLKSFSSEIRPVISRGGGVTEWIGKGKPHDTASIDATVSNPGKNTLRHYFAFRAEQQFFRVEEERIQEIEGSESYSFKEGTLAVHNAKGNSTGMTILDLNTSVLRQLRDPINYPGFFYLSSIYERICLYREWTSGQAAPIRNPQKLDLPNRPLLEDFSNLGLFLNRLQRYPNARTALLESLRDLYAGLTDFYVNIEGGTGLLYFSEGKVAIPATRLSDGSLHYLCLLAILHDPDPPPLIVIEEPELGLHPDLLHKVADLLVAASQRTQLVVTTHSDVIVDSLTEHPEAVVVCEKREGCTTMQRLSREELKPWLDKYRLGQLWTMGDLGGTRW